MIYVATPARVTSPRMMQALLRRRRLQSVNARKPLTLYRSRQRRARRHLETASGAMGCSVTGKKSTLMLRSSHT